jgi:hypothetical protein
MIFQKKSPSLNVQKGPAFDLTSLPLTSTKFTTHDRYEVRTPQPHNPKLSQLIIMALLQSPQTHRHGLDLSYSLLLTSRRIKVQIII